MKLFIIILLLVPFVSAHDHAYIYANSVQVGYGHYWQPFSPEKMTGPDIKEIFNPTSETFCHTYKLGGEFPVAEYFGRDVAAVYHAEYDRKEEYWSRGTHPVRGTVDIRKGDCKGVLIGTYEFKSEFSWNDPYPYGEVDWWGASVRSLTYTLNIPTVGRFTIERKDDYWSWTGISFTQPHTRMHERWTEIFINPPWYS